MGTAGRQADRRRSDRLGARVLAKAFLICSVFLGHGTLGLAQSYTHSLVFYFFCLFEPESHSVVQAGLGLTL